MILSSLLNKQAKPFAFKRNYLYRLYHSFFSNSRNTQRQQHNVNNNSSIFTHHQHQSRRNYTAYAWGTSKNGTIPLLDTSKFNDKGLLANLDQGKESLYIPTKIDYEFPFSGDSKSAKMEKFICGSDTSAAIFSNGDCFIFGDNSYGKLGLGLSPDQNKFVSTPTQLTLFTNGDENKDDMSPQEGDGVKDISMAPTFSALVTSMGDLYTFGSNGSNTSGEMGYLGHGDGLNYDSPKLVESLVEDGCIVKRACTGESHMTVLTTEGEVLTCGSGSYGRLGNLGGSEVQLFLEPVDHFQTDGNDILISDIAQGHAFTLALSEEGIVYAWGRNDKGQMGDGGGLLVDMYALESSPVVVGGALEGQKVVKISAGNAHCACVTEDGELYFWGMHVYMEPTHMDLLGEKCVDVECGHDYTMALTERGELFTFGKGKTGVLGIGQNTTSHLPQFVSELQGKRVVSMSAGATHCAVMVDE